MLRSCIFKMWHVWEWDFFFYTIDLHEHSTKTKSLLNKRTTEPYLIYGYQVGETKKVKKNQNKEINIYVYIKNVYNIF